MSLQSSEIGTCSKRFVTYHSGCKEVSKSLFNLSCVVYIDVLLHHIWNVSGRGPGGAILCVSKFSIAVWVKLF